MGSEVGRVATERGHHVALIVDQDNLADLNEQRMSGIDVAFEFTSPKTAHHNVQTCMDMGIPVVCGTTGWSSTLPQLVARAQALNGTLFYASNFSVGVHIFFKINALCAKCLSAVGGYIPELREVHHVHKLDAPSGTAIALAELIAQESAALDGWTLLPERAEGKIAIEAVREGEVFGEHRAVYSSSHDIISIEHRAQSRRGLALGAVLAAELIAGKRGFFCMDDLVRL